MASSRRRSSVPLNLDPSFLLGDHRADPSHLEGARNALVTCLGLQASERVVLVVEAGMEGLAAAFVDQAEALGALLELYVVDSAQATNERFIERLVLRLGVADVSLLLASMDGLPALFRKRVMDAEGGRRHGHLPGLDESIMTQSMRADYEEVERLGLALKEVLEPGGTLEVTTPRGTDLRVQFGGHPWYLEGGILRGPGWTNLPAGELLTCPDSVEGVLVPDGGAWDAEGRAIPNPDRLRVFFEGRAVAAVEGGAGGYPELIERALAAHPFARRVGQAAFGTNLGVVAAVGSLLQDLKMPGFHIGLGHAVPEHTGARWVCPVQIPLLCRRADVTYGGRPLLRNGRFARDLLP